MDKLVILKSIGGSFESGFQCSLSIATEGQPSDLEILGALPINPSLPQDYRAWQATYRNLGLRSRISGSGVVRNGAPQSDCKKASKQLQDHLNHWLRSPSFAPIRDKLQEQLQPRDRVRLVLQVDDLALQQLPWHAWELLDRYHKIEIAVASPTYQAVKLLPSRPKPVRVLAILGDASGIDIQADRTFLEALPNADVTFLVEPKRQDLSDYLWNGGGDSPSRELTKHSWDVLFFAGHSVTQEWGYVYINPTEKLPIAELKFALRRSVEQGLQLAIFNSCDGFGLARDLAELHIPQTIFMREPVPDRVAQAFLKHFLTAFAHEEQSLYLAVRSAREHLQTSESEFLCANWLPMIFQNLAVRPKNWCEMQGEPEFLPQPLTIEAAYSKPVDFVPAPIPFKKRKSILAIALISLVSTGLVSWVRHQGWMQPIELQMYDQIMQVESLLDARKIESSTMVITIDDDDQRMYGNAKDDLSISDENLFKLIQKLKLANADVIGVDLIRDAKGLSKPMSDSLRTMDNLIGACYHSGADTPGLQVSQGLDRNIGFVDMAQDPDGRIRRHLFTFPASPECLATHSMATVAAAKYLNRTPEALIRTIPRLDGKTAPSAYQQTDERNSLRLPEDYAHLLIHYRSTPIRRMSMGDFMNNRSGNVQFAGKMVFIGVARSGSTDYHATPLTPSTPGVFIHAAKADDLVRLVRDRETPIWVWSEQQEWGWILFWASVSGIVAIIIQQSNTQYSNALSVRNFAITVSSVAIVLYGSCVVIFMQRSGWVPWVPTIGAIVLVAGLVPIATKTELKKLP